MGGDGSGRRPSEDTLISRQQPTLLPIADEIFLPNYSGIKESAKRGSPDIAVSAVSETDPVFMALSGSLNYVVAESDPRFIALSGSMGSTYLLNSLSGSLGSKYLATSLSGSLTQFYPSNVAFNQLSGSFNTLSGAYYTHIESFNTLSGAYYTHIGSFNTLSGSHYTHIADSSDPHGANLTQTGITSSGTISGSVIISTTDQDASGSAMMRNIILDSTSGGYTASNYVQGTVLLVYA